MQFCYNFWLDVHVQNVSNSKNNIKYVKYYRYVNDDKTMENVDLGRTTNKFYTQSIRGYLELQTIPYGLAVINTKKLYKLIYLLIKILLDNSFHSFTISHVMPEDIYIVRFKTDDACIHILYIF